METIKIYHKNGKLKEVYQLVDGKIEGKFLKYWDNGDLMVKCYFLNGKRNGKSMSYLNKKKHTLIYFLQDEVIGVWVNYLKNYKEFLI
jgi:antitoxin component YwqK of YwqJK toxin-antitoxin module